LNRVLRHSRLTDRQAENERRGAARATGKQFSALRIAADESVYAQHVRRPSVDPAATLV